MSNDRAELITDIAQGALRAVGNGVADTQGTMVRYGVDRPPAPRYYNEEGAPGVELNNFLKRSPSEDGTYVLITEHTEHVEKIRQPPTAEEIAAKKEADGCRCVPLRLLRPPRLVGQQAASHHHHPGAGSTAGGPGLDTEGDEEERLTSL